MTTDDELLRARLLAFKKAQASLELAREDSSIDIANRLYDSDEGQDLTLSQKCEIQRVIDALEPVLQQSKHHRSQCGWMTTDDQMLQARILALKWAQEALESPGSFSSMIIRNRLYNSDKGRVLSPSQKCAIEDILGIAEAVLQGLEYLLHCGDCRSLKEGLG